MTNGVVNNILDITKKRLVRSLVLFGVTLVNILLTWIWVNQFGVIGAVIATAITMFVGQVIILNIYYNIAINIEIIRLYWNAYSRTIPIFVVCAAIAYIVSEFFPSALLGMLAGGGVYVVLVAFLLYKFSLNNTEKRIVSQCMSKMKRK